jgi:hypothetical protein
MLVQSSGMSQPEVYVNQLGIGLGEYNITKRIPPMERCVWGLDESVPCLYKMLSIEGHP